MVDCLDWKYISQEQILQLEACNEEMEVKRLLFDVFDAARWDKKKQKIAVNFHFYNYAFCKERAFNERQTSTFLSIMNEIMLRDAELSSVGHSMENSFDFFKEQVLKHSIEMPPRSVLIFHASDVEPIVDFALNSYFRNFKLYNFIFGSQTSVTVQQVCPNFVEYPKQPPPLHTGFELNKE